MLRKLLLMFALCLVASVSANAQSLDAWGGYSYMRFRGTPAGNYSGFTLGVQYKLKSWLGAVGEFGSEYGSPTGAGSAIHTFLVGPQVSFPGPVSPFAHVLLGAAHFGQGSFGDTALGVGYGFGVDTRIAPSISWRIFEADVIHTHFFGSTQDNLRLSTGIVVHF